MLIKWKVTYVRLVKFKLNCKCNNLPPCTVSVYPQKINNRFVPYKEEFDNHGWKLHLLSVYSYFKRGCQKKCACDNPKGNMGYYQHTVPETIAVEPTLVAFLSHSQTYVHGLSCHSFKFLWRTENSKPSTIPFRIVAYTFSNNLSWNSCMWFGFACTQYSMLIITHQSSKGGLKQFSLCKLSRRKCT